MRKKLLLQILAVTSFVSLVLVLGISHKAYADLPAGDGDIPPIVKLVAANSCASTGNATAEEQWLSLAGNSLAITENNVTPGQTIQLQWNIAVFYCDPNGNVPPADTSPDLTTETNFVINNLTVDNANFGSVNPTPVIGKPLAVFPNHTTQWYWAASAPFNFTVASTIPTGTTVITVTEVNQSLNSFNTADPRFDFECVGTPVGQEDTFNDGRGNVSNFTGTNGTLIPPAPAGGLPACPTEKQSMSFTVTVAPPTPNATLAIDCSNNLLKYTINNTAASGQADGWVGLIHLGTNLVPPDSNSFPIPSGQPTGTFSLTVTLPSGVLSSSLAYDCTGGGGGGSGPPPGSSACVFPLTFDSGAPLTWDPGEKVSITAQVTFTPPPEYDPNPPPPVPDGYTITTVNSETVSITAPGWATATSTVGSQAGTHTDSVTFTGNVPATGTFGPFNVQWSFSYNETVTTVSYRLISFTNKFGSFTYWQPIFTSVNSDVTPAPTDPCVQPGAGATPGSPGGVPTAGQPGGPGGPGTGGPANPNQEIDIKPYVRVYGGDVAVGDDFCAPAGAGGETMAGIFGWAKEGVGLQGWSGGAATQLAAEATRDGGSGTAGDIDAFASASNVMGSDNKPPPTGLSFSNVANNTYQAMQPPTPATEGYGGELVQLPDGTCQGVNGVDYYNARPTSGVGTYNQSDLLAGGTFSWGTGGGTLTLGNQVLGVDANGVGQHTVLYVNGNVEITGNIQFAAGSGVGESFNTITAAPSFTLIAKGNISIDPGVTELDGVYIAEPSSVGGVDGVIDTCDVAHDANYYSHCSTNQLVINGSLIASTISLGRAINTVDQSTASETSGASSAAEIVNYNPLLWMQTQTVLSQTDDSIVSLPPINP